MKRSASKHLVVDASIARAAGGEHAQYPTSKHCRDFLLAILRICHGVVMTRDIDREWKRHRSRFARTWLKSMIARKKFEHRIVEISNIERERVRECLGEKDSEAAIKDLHLIQAAMQANEIVASLDENAHKAFDRLAASLPELKDVLWINPDTDLNELITWLEAGAESDTRWALGRSDL